jgi:hypothetical protein
VGGGGAMFKVERGETLGRRVLVLARETEAPLAHEAGARVACRRFGRSGNGLECGRRGWHISILAVLCVLNNGAATAALHARCICKLCISLQGFPPIAFGISIAQLADDLHGGARA